MGTRRNDSYSFMKYLVLIIIIITLTYGKSRAGTQNATDVLIATYKLPSVISPDQAEPTIAGLKKALADCEDNYLSFRIRYRTGIIYLKAGMSQVAKVSFEQIADDPECPELIRACSLNMVGQISRLRGENKTAVDAFNKVAEQLELYLRNDRKSTDNSASAKLLCSALFSSAEILEQQQNFNAAIAEYRRLLKVLGQSENSEIKNRYITLINDKVSQLYLRLGDIENYIKCAELLIKNYPQYHRAPIVELEIECIEFLKSVSANSEFYNGSFTAPAQLITYLKDSKGGNSAQSISQELDALYKKHENTFAGILLHYHYACLLDTLGDKEKATDMLARVFSDNAVNTNRKSLEKAIETIREYAKIQYAVTSAETADYKQALRVLSSLQSSGDNSHIPELAKSVTESIQTLRREVAVNDGNKN